MNIALIGYGRMGQAIEQIAMEREHEIVLKIDKDNTAEFNKVNMSGADVAIEFTGPDTAFDNVMRCMEYNIPVVCGSTGWLEKWNEAVEYCHQQNGTLLYASNFSVGVNIFFEVNKLLAALMAAQPSYEVALEEIHHTQKKDAPSGTAVSLAGQIMEKITRKKSWVNGKSSSPEALEIISKRIDPAPGTHKVMYHSGIDDIEIVHTAHSRTGFATGAVLAAEFLQGRKGLFSMKDVLGL